MLEKDNVIFVVVVNHKYLLSKWLEAKISLQYEDAKPSAARQCQIQHGAIRIVKVILLIFMIFAIKLNANVRNKTRLFQDNLNLKQWGFKIQ